MKKDKHIQVNLTEQDYNIIEGLAKQWQRSITNTAYILIKQRLEYLTENIDLFNFEKRKDA